MILWLDAQLPPALCPWLRETFGIEATALRELGLRDATDREIFEAARCTGAVLLSKDSDFVVLVQQHGPPPQLLWLTCGNVTNRHLQKLLAKALPGARTLILAGEPIVEIGEER